MKRNLVFIIGGCFLLFSCGNKEEKPASETDSVVSVTETGDTLKITKPANTLSVADSAKQLQDKDTAAKMIESAPSSVSIHLDSIPEQK